MCSCLNRCVYLCNKCMDTVAIRNLSGSLSSLDYGYLKAKYCKHACVAMKICSEHKLSMTKSDQAFDLRNGSRLFSLEKLTRRSSEKITVVYPALNLKGQFCFKFGIVYFLIVMYKVPNCDIGLNYISLSLQVLQATDMGRALSC